MFFINPWFLVFIAPAILLGLWAQYRISASYAEAQQVPAPMSGAAAARLILDRAGLHGIAIEQVPGQLSDHYDPSAKVLRLSPEVYHGRDMAAVGIAAHEAGHALQDAEQYLPLVVRNAAVPAASIGSSSGLLLAFLGVVMHFDPLLLAGICLFGAVVFFQIVNLPVEYDASARARAELAGTGIVHEYEMGPIDAVLSAAALTYVAATLQSILTLVWYAMQLGRRRD